MGMNIEQKKALALAEAQRKLTAQVSGPEATEPEATEPKGWGQTIKENLLGDNDPATMNFGEKVGTFLNNAGESMTLGLVGDEAAGVADQLIGRGDYADRRDHYRGQQDQFAEENPVASFASVLAPALLPGGLAVKGVQAAKGLAAKSAVSAVSGGLGAGVYGFMEGEGGKDNRVDSGLKSAVLGAGLGLAAPGISRLIGEFVRGSAAKTGKKAFTAAAPTVDDLVSQAGAKYDEATAAGITASGRQTKGVSDRAIQILQGEGLVSPSGAVPKGYTKVTDAIDMLNDFADSTMTPQQMQNVRIMLADAARSPGNEGRIGRRIIQEFDRVMEPLAPQIKEGNAIYARAMRGKEIEKTIELAGSTAGQFTGSGFENALRKEFRRLEKMIIKEKLPGYSADQIAAISRVARGGKVENLARDIGKAAPTGIVSAGMGGGIPFLIGNAIGGPTAGAVAGLGTMATGGIARKLATGMQTRNAELAAALVKMGQKLPAVTAEKYNLLAQSLMSGAASRISGPQ
jgi:hypothetical protein